MHLSSEVQTRVGPRYTMTRSSESAREAPTPSDDLLDGAWMRAEKGIMWMRIEGYMDHGGGGGIPREACAEENWKDE